MHRVSRRNGTAQSVAWRRPDGARAPDAARLRPPSQARTAIRPEGAGGRPRGCDLAGARSVRAAGRRPHRGLAGPRPLFRGLLDDHAADSRRCRARPRLDEARRRPAKGRGDDDVDLDALPAAGTDRATEICALDDALDALAKREPRRAKVIELRYFGGLSVEETAEALGVSPQTVLRDWKLARAWLAVELRNSSHP